MGSDWQGELIDKRVVTNETARRLVDEMYARYRWRPIGELHEDFGACVGVNIDDPGHIVIVHANDVEKDESVTHFTRFAPLTGEQAEAMRVDMHHNRLMKTCADGHEYSYAVNPAGRCVRCGAND